LEIVVAVAGYNSTNRWTDGLNIPAEEDASFFRKAEGKAKADLSTFKSPTSPKLAGLVSRVAPLPTECKKASAPAWPDRPPLEDRAKVEEMWRAAAARRPTLPVADGPGANWERLLATFPKAGKSRADGIKAAAEKGTLSPRLRAETAWAAARADRAWHALAVARDRLRAMGFTDDQVFALDGDGKSLPEAERAAVAFARKLTAVPATVTDADVEGLRKLFTDKQVAEIVHQVCTAAFFDRVTEAANLPLDR
jgi:alkylhydroperoxidase family enzyme